MDWSLEDRPLLLAHDCIRKPWQRGLAKREEATNGAANGDKTEVRGVGATFLIHHVE